MARFPKTVGAAVAGITSFYCSRYKLLAGYVMIDRRDITQDLSLVRQFRAFLGELEVGGEIHD